MHSNRDVVNGPRFGSHRCRDHRRPIHPDCLVCFLLEGIVYGEVFVVFLCDSVCHCRRCLACTTKTSRHHLSTTEQCTKSHSQLVSGRPLDGALCTLEQSFGIHSANCWANANLRHFMVFSFRDHRYHPNFNTTNSSAAAVIVNDECSMKIFSRRRCKNWKEGSGEIVGMLKGGVGIA